jgi:hypothetical protein
VRGRRAGNDEREEDGRFNGHGGLGIGVRIWIEWEF